jgi:uncharacterized protein
LAGLRRGWYRGCLPAILAVVAAASSPAATEVPFLSGRVNDYAHLLSDDERGRLETKLAELETKTGAQVAVLTIDTLGDEPIEDFAMRVVETWRLGQKKKNNGVLLFVAKADRKMRIEVGYGLEGVLTDAQCSRIIAELMRPRFRAGEFGAGIDAAADAIGGFIRGESPLPAEAPAGRSGQDLTLGGRLLFAAIFTLVVGAFSLVAVFLPGCQSWFLYAFLMPFYFAFPTAFAGLPIGVATLGAWLVGFPIAKLLLARTAGGRGWLKRHPGWAGIGTSSGHGGRSGGGWSSSGGGFSGGGGSFGGGGASGSW